MDYDKGHPAAFRTWIRQYLPWFIIDLGVADKIEDCEAVGGWHQWYNIDNKISGCYHCKVVKEGKLWKPQKAMAKLIDKWYETREWAEELICSELQISKASNTLKNSPKVEHPLGTEGWKYKVHGVGIDIYKDGNKGGIDFDFKVKEPDSYRLRKFMIKQLNDGALVKKDYRDLLQNDKLWKETFNLIIH